jgi:hypothetical protein
VSGALDDDLVAEVYEREARDVIALRRAVQQEPGAARAPGLRRQLLRLLPGRRLGTRVDALDQRRDVERERRVAERLAELGIGARPAFVPGDVEAPGPARGIGPQRIEIGGL